MNNFQRNLFIKKKIIEKYLTEPNYNTKLDSKSKFIIMDGNALHERLFLTQIDIEEKTITVFKDDNIKDFVKQLQSMILKRAIELGYTEEE